MGGGRIDPPARARVKHYHLSAFRQEEALFTSHSAKIISEMANVVQRGTIPRLKEARKTQREPVLGLRGPISGQRKQFLHVKGLNSDVRGLF